MSAAALQDGLSLLVMFEGPGFGSLLLDCLFWGLVTFEGPGTGLVGGPWLRAIFVLKVGSN